MKSMDAEDSLQKDLELKSAALRDAQKEVLHSKVSLVNLRQSLTDLPRDVDSSLLSTHRETQQALDAEI